MTSTKDLAKGIRVGALQMVERARASHIGSALSIADILAALYGAWMNHNPNDPGWAHRDRLILSKGHACVGLYAALGELGYFPKDELLNYGQDFSDFMNHISHKVPGVEFSTGSLGHGLPFAAGKCLAAKQRNEPWRCVVIVGDGEMDEGSNWEAMMFAAHHKLDNLICIIDNNNLQSLTTVTETLNLEPLTDKCLAFNWAVEKVDGHDHAALSSCLDNIPWSKGKPSMIIANTIKGKGVSYMENEVLWHYRPPNEEQLQQAIEELVLQNA